METQPPLRDYGLIGDCHTAALISRDGSVDWWCVPRFDSAPVFGRLLDAERGGYCAIAPTDPAVEITRRYLPHGPLLETRFTTAGGQIVVLDALLIDPHDDALHSPRLLRVIEGVEGRVRVRVTVEPRLDYAGVRPWIRRHGRSLFTAVGGDTGLVIDGDVPFEAGDHELHHELDVGAGDRVRLLVRFAVPHHIHPKGPEAVPAELLEAELHTTRRFWKSWSAGLTARGPHREAVERSALILKCLTYAPTGAIVASPTTSLPEVPGGARNWDYRFAWIRDGSFAVYSLARVGADAEVARFREFIERSAAGSAEELRVFFGIAGEQMSHEVKLGHVAGYRGAQPVRMGNGAQRERQFDIFGELLEMEWNWHLRGHVPDPDYWRFLCAVVDRAAELWEQPDRGIWERRGGGEHFTHSKVMCWVALDRGVRLAESLARKAPLRAWRAARDRIRRAVEREGVTGGGWFARTLGGEDVDAALLRLPAVGFVPYDDPRMDRTVEVIRERLVERGHVYRYRVDDGLPGQEGTFVACTFWMAEYLARRGRLDEARAFFEHGSAAANDLGLLPEEYDPGAGLRLGNFPLALSHYAHVIAALAIGEAERRQGSTNR